MASEHSAGANFAALEQRVTGLEGGVAKIQTSLDNLASNLAVNAKTPWGVILTGIGVMAGVMTTIGGLAYLPVREGIGEVKSAIRELDRQQVPRVEHEKVWEFQRRLGDSSVRRIERLEDDLYRRSLKP
jgi:hypothetical protein